MTFSNFIAGCKRSGRLADMMKTWRNAGVLPEINVWADLYRFLNKRRDTTDDTISEARKLWFTFKAANPQ